MEPFEIQCQNINHNCQKILQFCLNLTCEQRRYACAECLKDFHQKHVQDCFSLMEIDLLIQNEYQILIIVSEKSDPQLKIKVDQILQKVSEQLFKFNNIMNIRQDWISIVVETGVACYNNCWQQYLLSFCLKQKINKNQYNIINAAYKQKSLEIKAIQLLKQGNQLFSQEQYSQSIKIYKIIFKLRYLSASLLFNLCLALFLTNQNEEAEELIKSNLQIFSRNPSLLISMGEEISIRKLESNPIQNILFLNNIQKFQVYFAKVLTDFQHNDLALSEAELILNVDPFNLSAIIIKVSALLGQQKYGLALEFIEENKKIKPEYDQCLKFICLTRNFQYFSKYWSYEDKQDFQAQLLKFQNCWLQITRENVNLKKAIYNLQDEIELKDGNGFDWVLQDLSNSKQLGYFQAFQKKLGQNENLYLQLGNLTISNLFLETKFYEALKKINLLLKINPNSRLFYSMKGEIQKNLGIILFCLNRKEESLWCYKVAMYLGEPKDYFTKLYISALFSDNYNEEALEIFNNVKDLNDPFLLLIKGQILDRNKKYDEAQKYYENVLIIDPNNKHAMAKIRQNKNCSRDNAKEKIQIQDDQKQNQKSFVKFEINISELFDAIAPEDYAVFLMHIDESSL